MLTIVFLQSISLIQLLSAPSDFGANIRGAAQAPGVIISALKKREIFFSTVHIDPQKNVREFCADVYRNSLEALSCNKMSVLVGGDHSLAIGSIYASQAHCTLMREQLGVIWCDAHADFNTITTSPSGNLHGMPVSVLCGHTLPSLQFGEPLHPDQFAYFGIRDLDALEFRRFTEHNMRQLSNKNEILEWSKRFDRIHVSFDVDCCDPSIAPGVSTPVPNGKNKQDMEELFTSISETGKLMSVDCVELNPKKDIDNTTAELAADLLQCLVKK